MLHECYNITVCMDSENAALLLQTVTKPTSDNKEVFQAFKTICCWSSFHSWAMKVL